MSGTISKQKKRNPLTIFGAFITHAACHSKRSSVESRKFYLITGRVNRFDKWILIGRAIETNLRAQIRSLVAAFQNEQTSTHALVNVSEDVSSQIDDLVENGSRGSILGIARST